MEDEERLKMAIIAGASHALKYKAEDWKVSDDEVIKKVTEEVADILSNIDKK